MRRRTSVEAFHAIESQGLLSKRRFEVYKTLFHHGPLTAGETAKRLESTGAQIDSIRPRFAELKRAGVIVECGVRMCNVTGMRCMVWDVTEHLPAKPPKCTRIKCATCNGKGFVPERPRPVEMAKAQMPLFA